MFDLCEQPFSPINVVNEIYQRTGVYDDYQLTSIALLDVDSSSFMFKIDELSLLTNIDSLADQALNFNSEECKLTKKFVPQLGLSTSKHTIDYWQNEFLKKFISKDFKKLLVKIDEAQTMHFQRKELKLDEDPWDNYLFHDAERLAPLICHSEPLTVAEQIIVAKFIEVTLKSETIS